MGGQAWGSWWAIQWDPARAFELGIHLDPRRRRTNEGIPYGPYLDIHLPGVTISVGRNPIYAGELDLVRSLSRGGLNADRH